MYKELKKTERLVGVRNSDSGNEPLIDAFRINAQWGKLWPKVIARAWRIQDFMKSDKTVPAGDSVWYENLISGDPKRVRTALEQEGFTPTIRFDEARTNGKIDVTQIDDLEWFWENIKIVVKEREDGVSLTKPGDKTVEVKPYQKTSGTYKYKSPVEVKSLVKNLPALGKVNYELYNQSNGWSNMKDIGHILILTLPPKPKNVVDHAVALAEYESAGLVYPFTFCC